MVQASNYVHQNSYFRHKIASTFHAVKTVDTVQVPATAVLHIIMFGHAALYCSSVH